MRRAVKTMSVGAVIVLVTTVIKWGYIVDLLGITVQAATSLVGEGTVSEEFTREMDSLSVAKFINISFFEKQFGKKIEFEGILGAYDE